MKKQIAAALISLTVLGTLAGCSDSADIGKDEATKVALEDAGFSESDVTRLRVTKDRDDGRSLYEVEFTKDNTEYDYEIQASNGEIISSNTEKNGTSASQNDTNQTQTDQQNTGDNSQAQTNPATTDDSNQAQATQTNVQISQEEATKLALDRVPGATEQDIRMKLDFDDGYYKYEGDIIYNQIEYEFEIDANTGTFLEWSEEKR